MYPIAVPALKERGDDISLLAGFFLEQARRKLGINQVKFRSDVLVFLNRYGWPGNVRELEHVISRSALKALARSTNKNLVTITKEDCGPLDQDQPIATTQTKNTPLSTPTIDLSAGLRGATDDFQRSIITEVLEDANFNWAQAGRVLKTDRANLTRLSKRLGLNVAKSHTIERTK